MKQKKSKIFMDLKTRVPNNKKIVLSLIGLVMLMSVVSIAYGVKLADSARIDVSLISQEPDPTEPGQLVDLRFKVENTGGGGTENIIFEVVLEYPFSLYKGDNQKNLGSMQSYQTGNEGIIVLYTLKVDEDAVEGTNYVDIKYKFGELSNDWIYVKDFPVRIRTRDLVLFVESIETVPALVSPGKEFELSLVLKNNADSLISDVTVNLDVASSSIPFAPSSSTAEKQLYFISSRTGKIVKFDLVALPDADGGIYKVPINISYTDEAGDTYSKNDYISLKISSTPDLLVVIDSSEVKGDVKTGTVTLRIVNRGLTNIKLLTAKVLESDDYAVLSEEEVYVGNIDSDDYETVDFDFSVKSYDKTVEIPIGINYMDATNKEYREEVTIELKTQSKGLIVTIISGLISFIVKIAILVGLVYGGYKLYKKWKKKKKRQG